MEFLGPFFFKNELISSTYKHTLTSSFLIYIPLNTLNYLIALRFQALYCIGMERVNIFVLFLIRMDIL